MKSTNKKSLLALCIAAGLGIATTNASAGTLASSVFVINNFLISDASTGNTLTLANFDALVGTNNGGITAAIGGTTSSDNFSVAFTNPSTDLTRVCVGPGCASAPAENSTTVVSPPPTANYGSADENLSGSSIDLGGGTTGANALVRADASLISANTASADANVGLNATFNFNLANPISIGFDFDAIVNLIAFTNPNAIFPTNAQASSGLEIVITELSSGNVAYDFNASGLRTGCDLGHTVNRNAPFNGTTSYLCSDSFSDTTGVLSDTLDYQLSIRQTVNSDVLKVPEPASIALLGAGLLGLGWARRRQQK